MNHFFTCRDGFCGATDCRRCHPENLVPVVCVSCGNHALPSDTDDRGLCRSCHDQEQCDFCGGWFDCAMLKKGLCHSCYGGSHYE